MIRQLLAAMTIGIAACLLAAGLAVDRFITPVGDLLIGGPAAALALALVLGAVVLRPAGAVILSSIGIVLGLWILLYAAWLIDPTPTAIRERANLLFALAALGPWVAAWCFRLRTARWLGVAGGIAMAAGLAFLLGGYRGVPDPADPVDEWTVAAIVVGLGLLGTWALTAARTIQDGRSIGRTGSPAEHLPTALSWRWSMPLPDRVARFAQLAGVAAIGDGVVRLFLAPAVVQTPALEAAEIGVALGWTFFIVTLVRAAPRVGEVSATGLVLFEWILPVSIPGATFISAVVLAAPISTFPADRIQPIELANGAGAILALAVARLGWSLRQGRTSGVYAAVLLILAAFAASGVVSSQPLPLIRDGGAALGGLAWVAFGLWTIRLGGRLRSQTPLHVFRPPRGAAGYAEPQPARPPVAPDRARRSVLGGPQGARIGRRRTRRRTPAFVQTVSRQRRWRQERTGSRHGLDELARRLGMSVDEIRTFRPGYRTFDIPKRSGGHRTITAPDGPTKAIQRRIHRRLLARLPAHEAAHGFERHRSIATNAALHANPAVLVKLDLQDFFGRTRTARIRRYWRIIGWDREAARILTRLTTLAGGLPQGAPTSPRLANLVNVRLDARLAGIARTHGARYSRYADDLTFSFAVDDGPAVRQLIHAVRQTVWSEGRYRLHVSRKMEIRRRHERQSITGLVVNGGAPRLDRVRRRWLRAVEHRRYSGRTPSIDDAALRGWQALEAMIEVQGVGGPLAP